MRIARKLGTITYRSAAEWRERFGREPLEGNACSLSPFAPRFAVEGYLEAQAERFTRMLRSQLLPVSLERHGPLRSGRARRQLRRGTARGARARVLVIGVESDMLFAIDEQAAIAEAFEHNRASTRFARLPSLEGHDAFLVDIARFSVEIRRFLAS